jgi:replicative DNA helicase
MTDNGIAQSLDAIERAVIGMALSDWPSLEGKRERLQDECFYSLRHKAIWRAVLAVAAAAIPNLELVALELAKQGELERSGGTLYLVECLDAEYLRSQVDGYIDELIEQRNRRKLAGLGQELALPEPTTETGELLNKLQAVLDEVKGTRMTTRPLNARELATEIEGYVERRKNGGDHEIHSGFYDLDAIIGGFEKGDMIVIAARPSMGKTALAVNIAARAAQHGHKVGIVSLEMPAYQIGLRLAAQHSGLGLKQLRDASAMEKSSHEKFTSALQRLSLWPLFMESKGGSTLEAVTATVQHLKKACGCELIVIDYLQLIRSPKLPANQNAWVSHVSAAVKGLAQSLDIPLVILSQLNRTVETRGSGNFKPCLSDLRDSGAIEQDADLVLFIYRPEIYQTQLKENPIKVHGQSLPFAGVAEIIVAKNRNGETGSCLLTWLGERTSFENRAGEELFEKGGGRREEWMKDDG